jgi:hypothetical protein
MPLKMAAKVDRTDQLYWQEKIRPIVEAHANVQFIGEIAEHEKGRFLGRAAALLFPIDWPEAFCAMRKRKLSGSRTAAWRFFQRHKITFKKKPERGGAAARRRGAGAATLDARTGHV